MVGSDHASLWLIHDRVIDTNILESNFFNMSYTYLIIDNDFIVPISVTKK